MHVLSTDKLLVLSSWASDNAVSEKILKISDRKDNSIATTSNSRVSMSSFSHSNTGQCSGGMVTELKPKTSVFFQIPRETETSAFLSCLDDRFFKINSHSHLVYRHLSIVAVLC